MPDGHEPNPFRSPKTADGASSEGFVLSKLAFWGTVPASIFLVAILAWFYPGLGIVAALILVPAHLRALIRFQRTAHESGVWPPTEQQLSIFFTSVLVCVPVLLAGAAAFTVVCFAGGMAAARIGSPWAASDPYGFGWMLMVGGSLGTIAGIVAYGFAWWWSLGKAKPRSSDDSATSSIQDSGRQ
ncbi:hypothetical protein DTL21_11670 [Bremerella cremea]|uniref:Uncharacterized protein n=1 Tax=Blastopirellula marina TaxID=124 RepID=A0A2S8FQ79_9BACT|nr:MULTISPECIES: hypothetical protein [Pirellulaceae]PQO34190.1 hypothetical protein C5Y83_11665 [Blastopirellula marina]RCS46686.1 hypothetical protein DTL21_11670 [Bremerella cremea]